MKYCSASHAFVIGIGTDLCEKIVQNESSPHLTHFDLEFFQHVFLYGRQNASDFFFAEFDSHETSACTLSRISMRKQQARAKMNPGKADPTGGP
jgi:hypothetical protein